MFDRDRRDSRAGELASLCVGVGSAHAHPAARASARPRDPRCAQVIATVRTLQRRDSLQAVIFGVWRGRKELASGALGIALPGVPATRAVHFRIGNTTESFETTLLLQLVDRGKIRLDDKLSKWYPQLPLANRVTVAMLASSASGYADYVKVPSFLDAFHASQPSVFPPGTSWSFSGTNFVLRGQILRRIGGAPVSEQLRQRILLPLKLRSTRMTSTADTPAPVLHGYTDERGVWEDDTFWSPTWATYTGSMTSTLADVRTWASAVGTGSLLSERSHARPASTEDHRRDLHDDRGSLAAGKALQRATQ